MARDDMLWDLSQLVSSTDIASIQESLDSMVTEAEEIKKKYHGKIGKLDADSLLELLKLRDKFTLKFEGPQTYSSLMYSADSTKDAAKQLNYANRKATIAARKTLAFIDIELCRLLTEKPSIVKNSVLTEYKHYLERLLLRATHMLSEKEEQLTIVKDKNGINAWEMLQNDWLSTRTFILTVKGKKKSMSYGEIIGFYQSQDRDLRRRANQTVYEGLGKDDIVWASAVRAVCEDHIQMCELRNWATPMTQSLLDNDVEQQIIDTLIKTIKKNVSLYRRYLKTKAKLFGLSKLANYDLLAPVPNVKDKRYSWAEARKEVEEAYREFDPQISKWIQEMYDKRHIDGEVRKGKTAGAFSSRWLAGKSAFVLQSFNGHINDVYAQAHELGHAMHEYLASRTQNPTNCDYGSCIAETGSIFGELLLTERLLKKAETREERIAILSTVIDNFGMAVFQVSARVFFEQSLYEAIRQGQFLDGKTVAKLWVKARNSIYGDAVEWLDAMKWEWTMKPHYYIPNFRFYNYPYVFAQLFVFALYRLYREQGKEFVPKIKALLAAGSSKSPSELAAELGFDMTKETFWSKGMMQAGELIKMLEDTM